MPRAGEMVEKIDTRDHAPATDVADLSMAAAHPESFWHQQAAERDAAAESQAHPPAGGRPLESSEGGTAEKDASPETPDSAPSDRSDASAASTGQAEQSSSDVTAGRDASSDGADFGVQGSVHLEQEFAAQSPLGSGQSQLAISVQTDVAARADVSGTPSSDLSAVQSVVDSATATFEPTGQTLSTELDAQSQLLDTILLAPFAVAASPLDAVEELTADHAPTSFLSSLFQPTADTAAVVPALDAGSLPSLEAGEGLVVDEAVAQATEEAAPGLAPLAGALLGSNDDGGDVDGLIGF